MGAGEGEVWRRVTAKVTRTSEDFQGVITSAVTLQTFPQKTTSPSTFPSLSSFSPLSFLNLSSFSTIVRNFCGGGTVAVRPSRPSHVSHVKEVSATNIPLPAEHLLLAHPDVAPSAGNPEAWRCLRRVFTGVPWEERGRREVVNNRVRRGPSVLEWWVVRWVQVYGPRVEGGWGEETEERVGTVTAVKVKVKVRGRGRREDLGEAREIRVRPEEARSRGSMIEGDAAEGRRRGRAAVRVKPTPAGLWIMARREDRVRTSQALAVEDAERSSFEGRLFLTSFAVREGGGGGGRTDRTTEERGGGGGLK